MTAASVFGIGAGTLSLVGCVPYIRDVFRGMTRPHRGSWLVWSALGVTAFASQLADGASWSLALVGAQAPATIVVFLLSIGRGVGGVSTVDRWLIGLAGVGVLGWAVAAQPVVATACAVVADMVGVVLMLPKIWHDPRSETLSAYAFAAAAGLLGLAAVGGPDPGLLLYPAYFAGVNGATTAVIVWRRRRGRPLTGREWSGTCRGNPLAHAGPSA